jgi:hypothetical protein
VVDRGASWTINLQEFARQVTALMVSALARIDSVDARLPGRPVLHCELDSGQ